MRRKPLISVILRPEEMSQETLRASIESVRSQWYPYWELCISTATASPVLEEARGADRRIKIVLDDTGSDPLELSTGEHILRIEDVIAPDILLQTAKSLH